MALPQSVEIKLGLYTLACRKFLDSLPALHAATQTNTRLGREACFQRFDEALQQIFEWSSPKDLTSAAKDFNTLILAQANLLRDINAPAAKVFEDLVMKISAAVDAWQYQDDLERLHVQGREIARLFFKDTPHPETQKRLTCQCHVLVQYEVCVHNKKQSSLQSESFGFCVPPTAYHAKFQDDDLEEVIFDLLLMRFTFEHNFILYLAYPFLFLHEYTAHVFSTDYNGNDRFNDGWMLYAVASFLKYRWSFSPDGLGLNLEQASVFQERLYSKLKHIPHDACYFAQTFDYWLSGYQPTRFTQITCELAAFQPQAGEKDFWPTQFINALESEFMTNRDHLLHKIQASTSIRELMTTLAPV
jgi:hypothetical protein